jgi:hypothetical protein
MGSDLRLRLQGLRLRLVDDARQWWRFYSVRAAAGAGMVAGWAVSCPQQVFGLIAYVPDFWRPLAGALVGFLVFALPTVLRLWKQGSKPDGQG